MTTTVTVQAPAPDEAGPRRRAPRGMVWAVLRLHRVALRFWILLFALAATMLLWAYGPGGDAAWRQYTGMDCGTRWDLGCDYVTGPEYYRYELAVSLSAALLGVLPGLVAGWTGGALIGRELENGTARLAWVQSVSPARWLAAELAVPAALLIPGTLLLTLLHRAVWEADSTLLSDLGWYAWHDPATFQANGLLATAYPLLGLAVGALVGLLAGRALPALGGAVLAQLGLMFALGALRPYLWPPVTITTAAEEYPSYDGLRVAEGALGADGSRVDASCFEEPACVARRDLVGYYADYHPASHFWPLQLVETGIVLALTAATVLAAFWLIRRRTR
ncbi:ABC transporter permease [Streptomyces sp. NPDC006458]|uniref:ABC transporter permease n=1 Tax=Streptomyces sp. NPDC006458 TaxID=3154302 RepID=UPI0033AAF239